MKALKCLPILLSLIIVSCESATEPKDCAGVAGGTAVTDECGVCGGSDEMQDCGSNCGGTICANATCSGPADANYDCAGNCTAAVDDCGVCGGDGTSCLIDTWTITHSGAINNTTCNGLVYDEDVDPCKDYFILNADYTGSWENCCPDQVESVATITAWSISGSTITLPLSFTDGEVDVSCTLTDDILTCNLVAGSGCQSFKLAKGTPDCSTCTECSDDE